MTEEKLKRISELEKTLSKIIKPEMTLEQKTHALELSFWRSHSTGYCDYMAGQMMACEMRGCSYSEEIEMYEWDCKNKWEVEKLLELLKEFEEQTK